jgi:hypothetical protein
MVSSASDLGSDTGSSTAGERPVCIRWQESSYCRAPLACSGFGYCRERNLDGRGMSEGDVAARRAEEQRRSAPASPYRRYS